MKEITETEGWVDEVTGYKCRVSFSRWWVGYVQVPESHAWHGIDYAASFCGHSGCRDHAPEEFLRAHGGITFSGIPGKESEGHWFGFDCAHAGDYINYGLAGVSDREGHRWTLDEVKTECASLARQLAEMATTEVAHR